MRSTRKQKTIDRWLWIGLALGASWLAACSDDSSPNVAQTTEPQQPSDGATGDGSEAPPPAEPAPAEPTPPEPASDNESEPVPELVPTMVAETPPPVMDPCALDRDFDGIGDCEDECPLNVLKSAPGVCGCDVSDIDTDVDGTLNCQDPCPLDPAKLEPGVCGCGLADADSDEDGALDCQEECPFDADRVEAGACGCGVPDDLPLCLRHRYSFDGEGEILLDGVGDADGTLINTTLTDTGTLALEGGATDQYVLLPAGIISTVGPSATIETWVTWTGAGGGWQRIFDFGSSDAGPGLQGSGATYLFLTPSNGADTNMTSAITNLGLGAEANASAGAPLPALEQAHVALVFDGAARTLSLYLQGVLLRAQPTGTTTLGAINDISNYLGRSQWGGDEEFQGVYDEFRIYSTALTRARLLASVAAGPDELPDPAP